MYLRVFGFTQLKFSPYHIECLNDNLYVLIIKLIS
jgi:hypothetical protein